MGCTDGRTDAAVYLGPILLMRLEFCITVVSVVCVIWID
jgi:hypothetical protein